MLENMGIEEFKSLLGTTASLSGILQMLAPVPICYGFIRKRTVGDMSCAPYVSACLSCSLWMCYGLMINDFALIQVNIIGTFLQLSYVIGFYLYCVNKSVVRLQVTFVISILLLTIIYIKYEVSHETAVYRVGLLTCLVTVVFFAAPLANLKHVLKVKSSESLPFLLILASFFVSAQWSLYGLILHDSFVQVPNLIGCVLCSLQLLLCFIYPRKTSTSPKLIPL